MRSNTFLRLSAFALVLAFCGAANGQLVDQGMYGLVDADINGDGTVNGDDAALLLSAWGNTESALDIVDLSPADGPTSDGVVDVDDLNLVQILFGETNEALRGAGNFRLLGVDIGGDPQNSDLLKGSPIRTAGGGAFYIDSAASGFVYAPTMGEIISEPSLEFTSYVALDSGPTSNDFTAEPPDFSTPGFTSTSGHFDMFGEVRGAWYTDAGVASSGDYPGPGQGVHVLRLSVPRGETLDTSSATVRALVLISPTTYVVNLPLQGGAVTQGEFGGTLPVPLEARAILTAQPDNVGAAPAQRGTGIDLDVYDVYVAEAIVLTVDPSGKGDSTTIQGAIDLAKGGETIVVNPGTYQENLVFAGLSLVVTSSDPSDPASFVIDGSLGDNQSVVTFDKGDGPDTILRGFTITGGDATIGGGILCSNSSPTIDRCVISNNTASSSGGGMRNIAASPRIVDCVFDGNTGGNGGAMANISGSSPLIERCRFVSNNATFAGGAIHNDAGPLNIVNSVFELNGASTTGGAIDNINLSNLTILNSTFATNNAGDGTGGALRFNGGSLVAANSIFWDNGPDPITGGVQDVSFSIVEGGQVGTGNLDEDPLFASPVGVRGVTGDYSLLAGSPAIDAGNNNALPSNVTTDLFGNDRFLDDPAAADSGAGMASGTFGSPSNFAVANGPFDVTTADFNNDGVLDLAVTRNLFNRVDILLGNGDGTFASGMENVIGAAPQQVVTGFFNGDGNADLAIATFDSISVLLGNGDGTFGAVSQFTAGDGAFSLATGNLDFDANVDLVVANQNDNNVQFFIGSGMGTFSSVAGAGTGLRPEDIASGDLNGDGATDFVTPNLNDDTLTLILSDKKGGYFTQTEFGFSSPNAVAIGDVVGDGELDIIVANNNATIDILEGSGGGSFEFDQTINVASQFLNIVIGDFDDDGNEDIGMTAESDDTVSFLFNMGDGTFSPETTINLAEGANPRSLVVADLDGNGAVDIATANASSNDVSVLLAQFSSPIVDMGAIERVGVAGPQTFTVDAGGGGDFTGIQAAVDAANSGDTINIVPGTYSESVDLGTKNLTLRVEPSARVGGGGVILDGGGEFRMLTINGGQDSSTVIDGLLFANGFGTVGGAVGILDGAPTIQNCTFELNSASFGGGLYVGLGQSPTITDCLFVNNDASTNGGGLFLDDNASPTVTGCVFESNTADGQGGAVALDTGSQAEFLNCTFIGNNALANGGALEIFGSTPEFTNCLFVQNIAAVNGGAVLAVQSADALFTNCTFGENSSSGSADIFYVSNNALVTLQNTIAWTGGGNDTLVESGGAVGGIYSLTNPLLPGTGNISSDPLFAVPTGVSVDLTLLPNSPAIDAGDNTLIPGLMTDLAGETRLVDDPGVVDTGDGSAPIVDMGAFEFQGSSPLPTIFVNANADGEADGVSWAGAFTNLQDAIDLLAASGDENTEIFVAQGTYVPQSTGARGTDFTATFIVPDGAHLIGGFSGDGSETDASQADPTSNLTILSGDTNGDDGPNFTNRSDNRWHVVTLAQQGGVSATLEGFTISGGNANGTGGNSNGGGIFVGEQGLTLIDCVVTDNMAAGHGAGVYFGSESTEQPRGGSSNSILGTVFTGNRAQNSGGAIYAGNADSLTIETCEFQTNTAVNGNGGAIWIDSTASGSVIYDSIFEQNAADNGTGGAVYFDEGRDALIEMCDFDQNTAEYGGAIGWYSDDTTDLLEITDCSFTSNDTLENGGALGIELFAGEVSVNNSFFANNYSDNNGGAVYAAGIFDERADSQCTISIDQCVFVENAVDSSGAAIYTTGPNLDVFIGQCSFGGHRDASSVLETSENLTLINSAFGENDTGSEIRAFGFANTITYNVFEELSLPDEEQFLGDARSSSFVSDNVIGEDPLFVDVDSGDLDLRPNSPAIDAGDSNAVSLFDDFLGRPRFQNDSGTPDTGVPFEADRGLAVVDIGAHEFQGTSMSANTFPFATVPTQIDEQFFAPVLALADLDGDSDLDVIASFTGKGTQIAWYENSRGDLSSLSFDTLAFDQAIDLDPGDFDNDGDTDVVFVTNNSIRISSNNGAPNPNFTSNTLVSGLTNPRSVKLGDLDNDGDLDVVVGLNDGDEPLRWYENTTGEFRGFPENVIESVQGDFTQLSVGELNGDGDLDFVAFDNDTGSVRAYINGGNGSGFTREIVDAGAFVDTAPVLADMNGDGATDILYARSTGDERGGATELAVAFNNGSGAGFALASVSDPMGRITSISVADIDGDGDLDAAAGDIANNRIAWIQNNGDSTFNTLLAFEESSASTIQLALGDMTLDGDMDLIAFDSNEEVSKNMLLIENLLIHRDTDFPAGRVLAREANGITTTDAADLDGDGDLDLISGSFFDNKVIWYENPGDVGGTWDHHELGDQITAGVTSVHALDYDNDGDLDIAATGIVSNSVDIYFNEINENSGDPTAFTGLSLLDGSLTAANDVQSGDFDNDGDLDLLAVGAGANEIRIAMNTQNDVTRGPGGGVPTVSVTTLATGVRAAIPVDVDNDGDLDIISAEFTAGEVRWYNNTGDGDGTTWERNFIAGVGTSPIDVVAGDFDRDGDADVAFADFATGDLWWYQNEFVESQLWEANNFASGLGGPSALTTCDFNDDGFLDIAVASRFSNTVRYYINSRAIGQFDSTDFDETEDSPVTSTAMGVQSIGSADLDGDGRCDLFVGTFAGDAMIRFRNLGGQFNVFNSSIISNAMDSGTTAEIVEFQLSHLGNDSDIDLALSSVSMRLLDAADSLLNATKAEQIFESISIQTQEAGRGQVISSVEIGAVSDFSGVSDQGILTIPIDSNISQALIEPGFVRTYTLVVELRVGAAMNSAGGFQIQISDPDVPSAVHAEFNSGELILQGDPDIDTGVVTVTEPQNQPCVADCDGSGVVNFSDLICILGNFGLDDAPGDVDGSGTVNFTDLVSALAFFGPCNN